MLIPGHLRGPDASANGGIAAGMLGEIIGGPATVRLHRPPPVEVELDVVPGEDGALSVLASDGGVVLTGRTTDQATWELPALDPSQVRFAPPPVQHGAPRCVVCGPDHEQSLRVFPEPLDGADIVATRWQPPDWVLDDDGAVRAHILWGVLDCPGAWSLLQLAPGPFFFALGTMTAEVRSPVVRGETVVVAGWPLGDEGRKYHAATAIIGSDGEVRARSIQTCIAMPLDWASPTTGTAAS